ncbi:hypothetical protein Hanom_Chr04g00356571 [Helianthus anomalus]
MRISKLKTCTYVYYICVYVSIVTIVKERTRLLVYTHVYKLLYICVKDVVHLCICRKMMFETEVGIGLLHLYTKDLQPSMHIGHVIFNCFASILNYEEVKRTS